MSSPLSEARWAGLFSRRSGIIKPGLERISGAWKALGYNKTGMEFILVAGTNGKGSTSGMLWHLQAATGRKAGLFTSPHLCYFRERFQVSHDTVDDEDIASEHQFLQTTLSRTLYQELTFFELSTLIGVGLFRRKGCDLAILEVGLGGRLDSTNITDPVLTAITSVDFDHQEWLGDTLEKIASEKLGIARQSVPLFWGEQLTKEKGLEQVLEGAVKRLKTPLFRAGHHFYSDETCAYLAGPDGGHDQVALPDWVRNSTPVLRQNFSLALAMHCQLMKRRSSAPATALSATEKFASPGIPWPASLMGRFQIMKCRGSFAGGERKIIVDVAHNLAAVREFLKAMHVTCKQDVPPCPLMVSILKDKDINNILDLLTSSGHPVVLFRVNSERSMAREDLAERHRNIIVFEQFAGAWDYAKERWLQENNMLAVCGSFMAVGEVLHHFSAIPKINPVSSVLHGTDPSQSGP